MRITKPKEGWFPCPDDSDKGRVLIKHLSPGERQVIFDKTMPQKIEYEDDGEGRLKPSFLLEPDREMDRELTLKACVVDWENFFDENDKPLKCNAKNVIRAAREIEGFVEFITECRLKLESDIKVEQEKQEKN